MAFAFSTIAATLRFVCGAFTDVVLGAPTGFRLKDYPNSKQKKKIITSQCINQELDYMLQK